MNIDNNLDDARNQLKEAPIKPRRTNSAAGRVDLLLPEIQSARTAGKGWQQIASDISQDRPLNKDAVRIAFRRSTEKLKRAAPRRQKASSIVMAASPTVTSEGLTPDLFAPMFDAFDMAGRGSNYGDQGGDV